MESRRRSTRASRSLVEEAEAAHAGMQDADGFDDEEQRRVLLECAALLMKGRDSAEQFRIQTAEARKAAQALKAQILEKMGEDTCLRLSANNYVRKVQSSSVGVITAEVVTEAFQALTMEEIRAAIDQLRVKERRKRVADRQEVTPFDALVAALYDKIRSMKKSDKVVLKMTGTLERGVKEEDIKDCPAEISKLVDEMDAVKEQITQIGKKRKREEEQAKERLKSLEEEAQQILLDRRAPEEDVETTTRGNFKLRCKQVSRTPPPKLTELKNTLLPAALEVFREQLSADAGLEEFFADETRVARASKSITDVLRDRKPVVSTKLSLDKVASRMMDVNQPSGQ